MRHIEEDNYTEQDTENQSDYDYCANITTGDKKLKAIKHRMSVEGKDVDFLIDTGASVNVLPAKYATQQLEPYEGKLLMWNNSETQPKGQCRLKLINPKTSKKYSVPFLVIQGNNVPILGLRTSMQMGLVTVNKDCDFVSNLRIDDFADVFDGGLGELPGTQHLQLKPDAIPVVMANRRTPLAVRPRLKTELERLVNLGVLTEVNEPTPWVSQIVITEKKNGSLRLCLDPHELNKNLLREHYTLPILEDVLHEMRNAKVLF